jgi:peptide/nickel transport system permease protein
VIVFLAAAVLPGDVGRRILGPFSPQEAVDQLNASLGTDRPLVVQYWDWLSGLLTGDLGSSFAFNVPVGDLLWPALLASAKLALLAFILVVPLAIVGGVYAALKQSRWQDRSITVLGVSATVIPEFVWSVVLILVFGLWLGILPTTARAPDGANVFVQVKYLLLPAMALVLVLFGYIARITRAGTVEALESDYARTAVLKGLPWPTVMRRHVLRNSLLPTIAVVATQTGYLLGGLVAIEVIFGYQGIGQLLYQAAKQKDFPVLAAAVLTVGIVYTVATLVADLLYGVLDPRIRHARAT